MHAIIDLDGTLVDTVVHVTRIINQMLADNNKSRRLDPDQVRPLISVGGERMMAALVGDACGPPAEAIVEFRARYRELPTPHDCLFEGVVAGLDRLAASGVLLSICTNKPQLLCEKVLSDLDLGDRFVVVVGGGSGLAPKPAPDLLDLVLARLSAPREQCCFVGDGEPDYLSARAVGMRFIFASYGYAGLEQSFEGAVRCSDFAEVTDQVIRVLAGAGGGRAAYGRAAA